MSCGDSNARGIMRKAGARRVRGPREIKAISHRSTLIHCRRIYARRVRFPRDFPRARGGNDLREERGRGRVTGSFTCAARTFHRNTPPVATS